MPVTRIKDAPHVRFAASDLVEMHAIPEDFGVSNSARGSNFMGGSEFTVGFCMRPILETGASGRWAC